MSKTPSRSTLTDKMSLPQLKKSFSQLFPKRGKKKKSVVPAHEDDEDDEEDEQDEEMDENKEHS